MTSFEKVLASLIQLLAQTPGREKLARFIQYFTKYLSSHYQEISQKSPHLRNEMNSKIKKSDALQGSMAMARKIFRFGPSINTTKTFIVNLIDLIKSQNKQSTPIFTLKTLSALWIAMFFVCDHYIWLYRMGIVKNDKIKAQCDYWSVMGWLLDCYTGLIKNILLYLNYSQKQKRQQKNALIIDSIRLILDIPVAYSFLKAGSVKGTVVGVCGSITSLIGGYQMWK